MTPSDPSPAQSSRRNAPKPIPVYFRREKGRLVHITLGLVHEPGSFQAALGALPEKAVNLLAVSISNGAQRTGTAEGHIFAEIESPMTPEELEAALRAVPSVRHIRVQSDVEGRIIDDSFPPRVSEAGRVLLFSASSFREALARMRAAMGSGGAVLVYDFGVYLGEQLAQEAVRFFGRDFLRGHIAYSMRMASSMGWGNLEVFEADMEKGTATIRAYENFECYRITGAASPYSQAVRGMLAGYFSGVLETPVSCQETECIAKGDEACVFHIERSTTPAEEAEVLPG